MIMTLLLSMHCVVCKCKAMRLKGIPNFPPAQLTIKFIWMLDCLIRHERLLFIKELTEKLIVDILYFRFHIASLYKHFTHHKSITPSPMTTPAPR